MGSSGQLYSLSWGEFGSSLTSAVQLLRGHGDLVDVTLAAGGRSFPAHKIVLSAASPFLLDLLKSTPCQHPVVMLAGISSDDLESLLEFVYRGEVSVEPSQLPSLLQAAHCLSIHGLTPPTVLTENGEEVPASAIPEATEPVTREVMNSSIPNNRRRKRRKSSSSCSKWPRLDNTTDSEERQEDDRTTDYEQKNEETSPADDGAEQDNSNQRWQENQSPTSIKLDDSHQDVSDTKQHLQNLLQDNQYKGKNVSDQPTTCPLCGAILRQSRNLRRHLELLHFGPGNSGNAGIRVRRRKTDFRSPTMVPRASTLHNLQTNNLDFSASSLAGNLLPTGGNPLTTNDQSLQSNETGVNTTINNGIYPTESTSMLNCLLSNLPSLPSLSSSHDVFRHSEILRAGIAYHDSSRQSRRPDIT